jgi:hypothetical protein
MIIKTDCTNIICVIVKNGCNDKKDDLVKYIENNKLAYICLK